MNVAFYDTLHLLGRSVGRGPIHRREATVLELTGGHGSVLAQFRSKPGRWAVIVETALGSCPTCEMNVCSRFLQFIALEDGVSLIDECGSNDFLDKDREFTRAQLSELSQLGWSDPSPPQAPNWFFQVNTAADLHYLTDLTARTLREVFGLDDGDLVHVSFNEVVVGAPERALASP